jgi:hypothetical protein
MHGFDQPKIELRSIALAGHPAVLAMIGGRRYIAATGWGGFVDQKGLVATLAVPPDARFFFVAE